ncbi:bifunctional transaldolase/phosoglucose isomerase [Hydrocarboniphaga sp.]|uniref:bifunctional transaldolase/phosoglucose isomerase n=1 Tax=Hydrocarboniphaga sp. TaxID=2033016 RepID=UPI003D0EF946
MSNLQKLSEAGQSPWLDFVSREFLNKKGLQKLVAEDGLGGVTSNPSIFEKAMGQGSDYDESHQAFLDKNPDAEVVDVYEHLAIEDIRVAADALRPVYDRTKALDGYVSLEVSPYLAFDTEGSLAEARRLWKMVDRPNLMVKIPGTAEGVPAIRQAIADGININVTLLFSLDSYKAVAEAFIAGLEERAKAGKSVERIASVASFFVSRIDAKIDAKIDARLKAGAGADEALLKSLKGKVAIANAKLAYQYYEQLIAEPRWKALAAKGAQVQRLLWASTGVKNPDYPDTLYVDTLIGKDTVNTMPPKTMDAFRDHGTVAITITQDLDAAKQVLADAERLGLDLAGVTADLVPDGAKQFTDAADALLAAVGAKRTAFLGKRQNGARFDLPEPLKKKIETRLVQARQDGWSRRLWQGDASLWTGRDEAQWLGWLAAAEGKQVDANALNQLGKDIAAEGYKDAVLLGMGGSSLGPEVLSLTLGSVKGSPRLHVLDSTDPQQIAAVQASVDLSKTLFIVSSKSGSTLEPEILRAYFHAAVVKAVGEGQAGRQFIAITDPGSRLEAAAKRDGYRAIFSGDPTIGGRYSVLSAFGAVPLAVTGHDVAAFYQRAQAMVRACGPSAPPAINPGVELGAVIGEAAVAGRDKLTIFASPKLSSIGYWLEQLLAESTGKHGKGIVPVAAEPIAAPSAYGADRLFAYIKLDGDASADLDVKVAALAKAGHPVVTITLADAQQIGQEFVRWEVATAIAGAVIGIDPFDQPDVEASKIKTRALTDDYEKSGKLAAESPLAEDGALAFYGDTALKADGSLKGVLAAHLARLKAGDYAALLAYVERKPEHESLIEGMRVAIRDSRHNATVSGFGPRFLHSTGQAYKGGPNSGVFLQITSDAAKDLAIPDRKASFGVVLLAQAQGDLGVLRERGRRWLRIHIKDGDVAGGLERIAAAVKQVV